MSKKRKSNPRPILRLTTTNLPGLEGVLVIVSEPALIKENSSKISNK